MEKRIIYVCPFTGRCGGTRVIAEHVNRLNAEWWGLQSPPHWFGRPLRYRQFNHTDELGAALQAEHNAAIVATWWQTASWVAPNLRGESKGYYLVQDIDELVYSGSDAGSSYKRGLQAITESDFVTTELRDLYGVEAINVGIGCEGFTHTPSAVRDPRRVLLTYRPGVDDLKGTAMAMEVMSKVQGASCVTFGPFRPPQMLVPHIHITSPSDDRLNELYNTSGLYLMTSRREGFGLPALEAMNCGCPVVSTYNGGNEEFCTHNVNSLLGRTADELATHIHTIINDPFVSHRLSTAGLKTAGRYRWSPVVERLKNVYHISSRQ